MNVVRTWLDAQLQAFLRGQPCKLNAQLRKDLGDLEVGYLGLDRACLKLANVEQRIQKARHCTDRLFLLRQRFDEVGVVDHAAHGTVEKREGLQGLAQIVT